MCILLVNEDVIHSETYAFLKDKKQKTQQQPNKISRKRLDKNETHQPKFYPSQFTTGS